MGARNAVLGVFGFKGACLSVTRFTNTSGPSLQRLLASSAVAAAIVGGALCVGLASPAMAADRCVNAAVRVQTGSTGLPECRAYEMVSAAFKEGFPVQPRGFTDDGLVSYQLRGAIAGNVQGSSNNLYHGVRSPVGWMTSSLDPSAVMYNTTIVAGQAGEPVQVESPDLRWSLWRMFPRGQTQGDVGYWLRGSDGTFMRVGDAIPPGGSTVSDSFGIRGASSDLSHVVLSQAFAGSANSTALVEYVGLGNGWPPRAVSVDNAGQPTPGETCLRSVSSDGRVIVFSSGCNGGTLQLWARVGGLATIAVSRSECTRSASDVGGLCNSTSEANYVGGAADGSRVFFTTNQQLVNGDIDQTNDLYACDTPAGAPAPVASANPCTTLTEVSGASNDAQVDTVVAISDDGSRVYFVARGVLADNLGVGDVAARTGDPNLYLWERDGAHPSGQMRFVTGLAGDLGRAQMTPDGRYLLFSTASQLVTGGAGADTDSVRDVYRYDASTHAVVRVSTSVAGGGGNDSGPPTNPLDASIVAASAMSDDGSTVVFETAEALSANDANGVTDVYSWRDGQVSLISAGGGSALGVTASGRDIFFTTDAPVLAADGDVNKDIYDARIGGGFEQPQAPSPCSGDQCQGLFSQPPGAAAPPAAVSGGGPPARGPSTFSLRTVSTAQRKALATTGRVSLTVTTNAPGTIGAKATATIGGRSVTVGSARRTLSAAGRVVLPLTLSKKARAQLASRGRLTVRVAVSHSKVALERAVTLRLVRTKKAKSSVKRQSAQRSAAGADGGRS